METRTNIVLDDKLVAKAMKRAGVKTKKAAVEAALQAYVAKPDYRPHGVEGQRRDSRRRRPKGAFRLAQGCGRAQIADRAQTGAVSAPAGKNVVIVDSSVWIAYLRGDQTAATARLDDGLGRQEPLWMMPGCGLHGEASRGARDRFHFARIQMQLDKVPPLVLPNLHETCLYAAALYARCRAAWHDHSKRQRLPDRRLRH